MKCETTLETSCDFGVVFIVSQFYLFVDQQANELCIRKAVEREKNLLLQERCQLNYPLAHSKLAVLWSSLRRLCVSSWRHRYFSTSSCMDWSTSVLTPLSSDTEPSIVVTFSDTKYIFNAGENLSRNALQTSRNWKRTRAVFLTQAKIDKISGLGGMFSSPTFEFFPN